MDNYLSFLNEVSKSFYVYHADKTKNIYLNFGDSVDPVTLDFLLELSRKFHYGFELWIDSDSHFINCTFYCDK